MKLLRIHDRFWNYDQTPDQHSPMRFPACGISWSLSWHVGRYENYNQTPDQHSLMRFPSCGISWNQLASQPVWELQVYKPIPEQHSPMRFPVPAGFSVILLVSFTVSPPISQSVRHFQSDVVQPSLHPPNKHALNQWIKGFSKGIQN